MAQAARKPKDDFLAEASIEIDAPPQKAGVP